MSDAPNETQETAALAWQAADSASLDWAKWNGGQALYHRPSGKTHFPNDDTVRLLTEILAAPRSLDEIIAMLWGDVSPEDRADLRSEANALLVRLAELGLVRPLW